MCALYVCVVRVWCMLCVVRVCYVLCAAASLVCCRLTGEKTYITDISVVVEHGVRTLSGPTSGQRDDGRQGQACVVAVVVVSVVLRWQRKQPHTDGYQSALSSPQQTWWPGERACSNAAATQTSRSLIDCQRHRGSLGAGRERPNAFSSLRVWNAAHPPI